MLRTIRARLVLSDLFLALLTVGVVAVLSLSLVQRDIDRQEAAHLQANAQAIARQADSLVWPVARRSELQELAEASAFLGSVHVRILSAKRDVLADSGAARTEDEYVWIPTNLRQQLSDLPSEFRDLGWPSGSGLIPMRVAELAPEVLQRLSQQAALVRVSLQEDAWGRRFTFSPYVDTHTQHRPTVEASAPENADHAVSVAIGDSSKPLGYVELTSTRETGAQTLAALQGSLLWAGAAAVCLAVFVGLLVGSGLTAPLRSLSGAAQRMGAGDLTIRAPVCGNDEIAQLSRQFNWMAERLEDLFAQLAAERDTLRRFVADASHELRTPITALKNFVCLLQGAAAGDPAARSEFLSESERQLERLEWITSNLLDLSRLDAGLAALHREAHAVGEMIDSVASTFAGRAAGRNITLQVELPQEPITLVCDKAWLEIALSNLVDNALKFTPGGGRVGIGAQQTTDGVELWVADNGPGISAEDLPHIFERFYRGKGAPAEGSGLGLSIVRSVAQAHGGQVTVQSSPGTGSRFALQFPQV